MNPGKVICILIVVAMLFFGALLEKLYIQNTLDELLFYAKEAHEQVNRQNMQSASVYAKEANRIWEKNKKKLSMLFDHEYLYNVDSEFSAFLADLSLENFQQLPSSSARLILALKKIRDMENVTIANIF